MAVVALIAFVALGQNEPATTALHIEGMTCGSCATAVKIVLRKTPGVKDAKVSYEEKRADVTYDPSATSPQKIAAAIADALAYTVTPLDGRVAARTTNTAGCDLASPATGKPIALSSYSEKELRDEFNRASDQVRMIALLSPTCGACQHGQRVVESVFSKFSDQRLHGFVVWLPMLSGDNVNAAQIQAGSFTDRRVVQRWDEHRLAGAEFSKTLKLKGDAWDVYLLYAPGVKWTGATPPAPTFWMHQLRAEHGADQKLCLNPAAMTAKVQDLLKVKNG
jgi:copper chaperone CopZ